MLKSKQTKIMKRFLTMAGHVFMTGARSKYTPQTEEVLILEAQQPTLWLFRCER